MSVEFVEMAERRELSEMLFTLLRIRREEHKVIRKKFLICISSGPLPPQLLCLYLFYVSFGI